MKNSLCFRKNRSYRDRGTFNRNLQHLEYYVHVHICMLSSHKSDRKMYYSFYLPKTCHGNTETCLIICIHSANQEMLAYGAANFFGSFFHCFPTAGSLSRSSLLADLNSHSQLPALIGTVFIVVCIGRKDGVKWMGLQKKETQHSSRDVVGGLREKGEWGAGGGSFFLLDRKVGLNNMYMFNTAAYTLFPYGCICVCAQHGVSGGYCCGFTKSTIPTCRFI